MMDTINMVPPGEHTLADQRNWQPATTLDDYLANCREGLEAYSDKRAAKLLGVSRAKVQRMKQMAFIPDELFDRLLDGAFADKKNTLSTTELARIGQTLEGRGKTEEIEACPCCGYELRVRRRISKRSTEIVLGWLREKSAG